MVPVVAMLPVVRSGARFPAGAKDIIFYSPELPINSGNQPSSCSSFRRRLSDQGMKLIPHLHVASLLSYLDWANLFD